MIALSTLLPQAQASVQLSSKTIASKFGQAAGRLDTSLSPSLPKNKMQSQFFQISQLVGIFLATLLVAQCPYNLALLGILAAAFVTPLTSQFFVPAAPILFYLLLTRCIRSLQGHELSYLITLPSSNVIDSLEFNLFPNTFHIMNAFFLWLSHFPKILHVYATAIGCMNSIAFLALLVLPNLWEYSDARSLAFMDGTNVIFVALTLCRYLPMSQTSFRWSYLGALLCCSFLLAIHYTELICVIIGGGLAVTSFSFFFPDRIHEDIMVATLEPIVVLSPPKEQTEKHRGVEHVVALQAVQGLDAIEVGTLTSDQMVQPLAELANPISLPVPPPQILEQIPSPLTANALSHVAINPHKFNNAVFEEIALLGRSSTRTLHQVRHKRNGAVYVRKSITPRELPISQVQRELHPLRALRHVNIVKCYGIYGGDDGDLNIVLEYQAGGNLSSIGSRVKQMGETMEENVVGRITEGILQGLAYLHNLQIVHRDIKPANILLSRDGVVKLSEFVPSGESPNKIGDTFFEFVPYISPERISGAHYTDRVDIWSMGITLIECIQNRRPYPAHLEDVGLMLHITDNNIAPPCLAAGSWSDNMRAFISKTLAKDPNVRPGAAELLRDPWIAGVMQKDVRVGAWLRRVWNWPRLT